jgi:tetratricopeptide (TPR) repeat protein
MTMKSNAKRCAAVAIAVASIVGIAGCDSATIQANNQMVQTQQQQIEENQRQIAELKAQQPAYAPGGAPPASGCDRGVANEATKRGGERMASRDYSKAVGYYNDALAACSSDPQAELNVARAYEASGDRASAVAHFKASASGAGTGNPAVAEQARDALIRLGASN